jgi:hypothetical protein
VGPYSPRLRLGPICGLIVQWAVAERVVHLAGVIYEYR